MAEVTECPNFRLHLLEVLQRIVQRIAVDTHSDMVGAGFAADEDDLEVLAEFVHHVVSDALVVGWGAGAHGEVST